MVDMISISSLAQRFRPRPAVLPPAPAIIPLMASQQQAQPTPSQHQQSKHSSTEVSITNFPLTSLPSGARTGHTSQPDSTSLVSDPVLGSSNSRLMPQETTFGSLPINVLTPIVSLILFFILSLATIEIQFLFFLQVRLSKILNMKKEKIRRLRDMNTEVERRESVGETVAPDFQRRYARTILDLEELNTELNSLLVKVRQQCHEVFCFFP